MTLSTLLRRASIGAAAGAVASLAMIAPADASPAHAATAAAPRAVSSFCNGRALPLDCWVTEPVVNAPSTTYPAITFLPGDHVSVDAGGCVQTGGHGLTWKRYVNPASDNGLYHGLITIPGATANLQQIWTTVGRTFTVGGSGGKLVLGYQDDGYSDNGYTAHDNGTGDQCKNVGNAWVHLVIS